MFEGYFSDFAVEAFDFFSVFLSPDGALSERSLECANDKNFAAECDSYKSCCVFLFHIDSNLGDPFYGFQRVSSAELFARCSWSLSSLAQSLSCLVSEMMVARRVMMRKPVIRT